MVKEKLLYEAIILIDKNDLDTPSETIWIASPNIEEALNKLKEFLENKNIKKYEILKISKKTEGFDHLIV